MTFDLGKTFDWFTEGDNLKGLGTFLGAGGSIYGAINGSKIAKDTLDWQKQSYNQQWNDMESERKRQQDAYRQVFGNNSGLGSYSSTTGTV